MTLRYEFGELKMRRNPWEIAVEFLIKIIYTGNVNNQVTEQRMEI